MMLAQIAEAQVKIGDDKLEIGVEGQFEIQKNDTLLVISDNLTLGRTINQTANTLSDALMIKLLDYGINNYFHPDPGVIDQYFIASGGTTSNVFLGITSDGQVMEAPLRLLLEVDTSNAYISLFNEVDTFGTVDLAVLDSIFVTDNELIDSLNTIRTLINNSNDADNDTLTGNEYIDTIQVLGDTLLRFVENRDMRLGDTNT
ncbi:MAG: hypothetical protein ACJA01_002721 [Saprospiraceae bacterium]|jgi:hypothetical protein